MKTITLHRPNAIQHALSDFDRYFESFFGDAPASRVFGRVPAVDVMENETAYVLEMELPGYDEKGIEVHVDGSSLSIASKREVREANDAATNDGAANDARRGTWLIKERRVQSFSRSFKMPENADPEGISAEFRNGVLCLEIGKKPEARKRSIQIKAK